MMAIRTCWALLLLLALFPAQAIARRQPCGDSLTGLEQLQPQGRAPSPATSIQMPPEVQVHGGRSGAPVPGEAMLDDGTQFQGRAPPPSRKLSRQSKNAKREIDRDDSIYGHRLLVGSAPPTCQGKCGQCNPCSPIHMAIGSPHGALTQQEYYPEVWRCKCGGIYFMP